MAVTRTHFPFRIDVRTATARALSIVDCADDCAALPVGLLRFLPICAKDLLIAAIVHGSALRADGLTSIASMLRRLR
jgi:hypothetical protein